MRKKVLVASAVVLALGSGVANASSRNVNVNNNNNVTNTNVNNNSSNNNGGRRRTGPDPNGTFAGTFSSPACQGTTAVLENFIVDGKSNAELILTTYSISGAGSFPTQLGVFFGKYDPKKRTYALTTFKPLGQVRSAAAVPRTYVLSSDGSSVALPSALGKCLPPFTAKRLNAASAPAAARTGTAGGGSASNGM